MKWINFDITFTILLCYGFRLKNKRKPKLNFSNFVFHENTHGCTIIVKVNVLFTTQYKFAYILLIMSKLFLKIIEWHAMKKKS